MNSPAARRMVVGYLLLPLAIAACGKVAAGAPDALPADTDASPAPGSVVWQRNLFGSFTDEIVVTDQIYVGASMFSELDLGKGKLTPAAGLDLFYAHYDLDGNILSSWRHGGAANENIIGFSVDPFGHLAVGGLYYDGIGNAGGADLPAATGFEGVAASYDESGNQRWQLPLTATTTVAPPFTAQVFPGSASTNANGLTSITGRFRGTLSAGATKIADSVVDPSNNNIPTNDIFYLALNDTGAIAAAVTFGSTGDDVGFASIFDPLGTVILVGAFSGKVAFGSTVLDAGTGADLYVVRMTPGGSVMWAIQGAGSPAVAGSPADVIAASAAVTRSGDIVVAVTYQGTFQMTGGSPVTALGASDIALVRISSAGTVTWTRSFGGTGIDRSRGVAVGITGDIALTGEFNGAAAFGGPSYTTSGGYDTFIAKYTADGDLLWSHAAGSAADDRGLSVALDASGAVYTGYSFHNTVDFGGGPISSAAADFNAALVKYRP
jgi:hypothetical protein